MNYKIILANGQEFTVDERQMKAIGQTAQGALKGEGSPFSAIMVVMPNGVTATGPVINVLQVVYATHAS
jgi:hypothetical protein